MKVSKNITDSPYFWIAAAAVTAGTVYFVARVGAKAVEKIRENNANLNIDKTGSKQIASVEAQRLYAAFFPSGTTWMPDGTDEEIIFSVADSIRSNKTTWADLVNAYNSLFKRNLVSDLNDELDSSELSKFWIRAGKSAINGVNLI